MNMIAKCDRCACEPVCIYKAIYKQCVEDILNTPIQAGKEKTQLKLWPHIEVSIRCPHKVFSFATNAEEQKR